MKISITEDQLKKLIVNYTESDLEEQDAGGSSSPAPSSGAGSTGSKQGYPEVSKWESGITRGPANQIGLTKWSDVVGSSLKRSKSNELK